MNSSGDYRPRASWENLRLRAELLRRLRAFFDARGFLEVQTPVLSADTVVDRHLNPFRVETNPQSLIPNPSPSPRLWLQTSPEFAMKRLLAAGAGPIYEVARVFRRDEVGPLHNPEFTLIEWYQPGDSLEQGMQLTSELCETLLEKRAEKRGQAPFVRSTRRTVTAKGACPLFSADATADGTWRVPATNSAERISYRKAFLKYVGVDPDTADACQLAATVRALGIEAPASMSPDDRDGWLDLILVERIQPHLGVERPTLLYDYPASQAALARIRRDNPPVAERFELYVAGIELANGYHELLDPDELRRRNSEVNAQRRAEGKEALPEESRLLKAMEAGLPSATGVALGFDRLAMLAAGAKTIAEVMAFPFDRA